MSIRKKNSLLCFFSLLVGCLLYVLFRPTTYIGNVFNQSVLIDIVRQVCSPYANDIYRCYLPDFLWAFALGCGLIAIYDPGMKGVIACAIFSFAFGFVWEVLQYANVVHGTGDVHDIVMYFLGSAVCIIINFKERKKNEKS